MQGSPAAHALGVLQNCLITFLQIAFVQIKKGSTGCRFLKKIGGNFVIPGYWWFPGHAQEVGSDSSYRIVGC